MMHIPKSHQFNSFSGSFFLSFFFGWLRDSSVYISLARYVNWVVDCKLLKQGFPCVLVVVCYI